MSELVNNFKKQVSEINETFTSKFEELSAKVGVTSEKITSNRWVKWGVAFSLLTLAYQVVFSKKSTLNFKNVATLVAGAYFVLDLLSPSKEVKETKVEVVN